MLRPEYNPVPYFEQLRERDIAILAVIASESLDGPSVEEDCGWWLWRTSEYLMACQLGNEPDQLGDSSWTQTPQQYAEFLAAAVEGADRAGFDKALIGAGLASGNPKYWAEVEAAAEPDLINRLSAIAVHPYGIKPLIDYPPYEWGFGVLQYVLEAYRPFGLPIVISEFGCTTEQNTAAFQAEYLSLMLSAFNNQPDIPVACWFTNSDLAVPGYGLRDPDNRPKPAWRSFQKWVICSQGG